MAKKREQAKLELPEVETDKVIDEPKSKLIKKGNRVFIQYPSRIEFLDQRFYYDTTDETFFAPSVTTILEAYPKPASFFEWLKAVGKDANDIRDAAGEVGTKIHAATERFDNGEEVLWDDGIYSLDEWQLLCRYYDFRNRYPFQLIANEKSYCSKELMIGGTIDRVFEYDGHRWLVDIKTSNYLYDHFWLQLAAYQRLWNNFNPELPVDKIAILHLKALTRTDGKDGMIQGVGWKLYEPDKSSRDYYSLFQSTYALWKAQNPDARPKNLIYPSKLILKTEN